MHQTLQVVYLKYGGARHGEYQARLISAGPDELVTFLRAGTPFRSHTRNLTLPIRHHTIAFFYRQSRWYSVHIGVDGQGRPLRYYCNVNTPVTLEGDRLTTVDLDLDVEAGPDLTWKLLDEEEFEQHRRELDYPDSMVAGARQAVAAIIDAIGKRAHPFNLGAEALREMVAPHL